MLLAVLALLRLWLRRLVVDIRKVGLLDPTATARGKCARYKEGNDNCERVTWSVV